MKGGRRRRDTAKTPVNGSVIVALLNGQFTVKRYYFTKDSIRSMSEK